MFGPCLRVVVFAHVNTNLHWVESTGVHISDLWGIISEIYPIAENKQKQILRCACSVVGKNNIPQMVDGCQKL